jgi:ABC-type nitrate/sulfonate/bicarbonate transport system permease component
MIRRDKGIGIGIERPLLPGQPAAPAESANQLPIRPRRQLHLNNRWGSAIFALAFFFALWQVVVWVGNYPPYILPSPVRVVVRFWEAVSSGILVSNTLVTLGEMALGFSLGAGGGMLLGYLLYKLRPLERLLAPYIAASQALPIVAIAPLLVL